MTFNLLIPLMAVVVAACLLDLSPVPGDPIDWRRLALRYLLAGCLLLMLGEQVRLGSIWDVATDGLRGPFLVLPLGVTTIFAALLLTWSLPRRWKWTAAVFALAAVLVVASAHRLGTYDPDGKWGKLPSLVTEQRAQVITQALERYQVKNDRYPGTLESLVPWYLVYIPNPFIIPGQTWCYQGGSDYYQLGYVYRAYFSSPSSVRIHATAGAPPVAGWSCP